MDFEAFARSRDLLYLSGVFAGIALGCIASLFRKGLSRRSRNRRITLSLLVFSFFLIPFTGAVIISRGAVFTEAGVLLAAVSCVPVFILITCFPRAVAFPFVMAGCLCAVWLGYTILRFPSVQISSVPLAVLYQGDAVNYVINSGNGDRAQSAPLQTNGSLSALRFTAAFIVMDRHYPLIGGTLRGAITEIHRDADPIYTGASFTKSIPVPGINSQITTESVPFENIPFGMNLAVVYNGDTLAFVPSSRPFRRGTELSMFSMRDNGGQSSKSRFGQPN